MNLVVVSVNCLLCLVLSDLTCTCLLPVIARFIWMRLDFRDKYSHYSNKEEYVCLQQIIKHKGHVKFEFHSTADRKLKTKIPN